MPTKKRRDVASMSSFCILQFRVIVRRQAQSLSVSAHDVDVEGGALLDDLAALKQELRVLRLETCLK